MTKDQAELLDKMLAHFLEVSTLSKGAAFFSEEVARHLKLDEDEVSDLWTSYLVPITFNNGPIVEWNDGNIQFVQVNYNTKRFIDYGGFIKFYQEELERKAAEQEERELNAQKLRNDIASFRISKKQYYWTIGFALAGLIISIFSIILQITSK